jgi:hypothetical protein
MWMNEPEIERTVEIIDDHAPQFSAYAKYLSDWRDVVNSNSDGWHSWRAGGKSADKLMTLLQRAVDVVAMRSRDPMPTEQDFKKSLTPIKSLATKHNLTAPTLDEGRSPGMGR